MQPLYSARAALLRAFRAKTTNAPRVQSMKEFEQEDPIPQGDLALQLTALPRETNGFGDIFGGWLVSQMDLAGTAMASRVAAGRVATVSIDRMAFMVPVPVGAQLSFYTQTLDVGRSSIRMLVEVWSDEPLTSEWRKVTEAVFVFVAIDSSGRTRPVAPRR
jgi:acyl-CoA thioesterase YciA